MLEKDFENEIKNFVESYVKEMVCVDEPKVWLTVEEAQLCLKLAIGSLIVPFGKKGPPKWVKETIEMLRSRIEQAEKDNESN